MKNEILKKLKATTIPIPELSEVDKNRLFNLYEHYYESISKKQFISMSAKITGIKAAKIVMLLSLLALPGIGQVVAVYLISSLMFSAIGIIEIKKEKLLLPAPIKWLKHL